MRRIASAMETGEVGSHSIAAADRLHDRCQPGRSDATTGTPAAIASHSFWGVVYRWFSEWGWIAITITSAEAVHSSSSWAAPRR